MTYLIISICWWLSGVIAYLYLAYEVDDCITIEEALKSTIIGILGLIVATIVIVDILVDSKFWKKLKEWSEIKIIEK